VASQHAGRVGGVARAAETEPGCGAFYATGGDPSQL
jgi:hypothetical protein